MPRTFTGCRHENRTDRPALIRSETLRDIATRTGTTKSVLERHRKKCMPTHLVKAKESCVANRGRQTVGYQIVLFQTPDLRPGGRY